MLLVEQILNGLQFGLMLFLLAAGLTLVFGIMDLVNLAHGSLYMIGAYFAATFVAWTGSFLSGRARDRSHAAARHGAGVRRAPHLYGRDHLDQVLATFGLILFFNEAVRLIWGPAGPGTAAAGLAAGRSSSCPASIIRLPPRRSSWSALSVALLLYLS